MRSSLARQTGSRPRLTTLNIRSLCTRPEAALATLPHDRRRVCSNDSLEKRTTSLPGTVFTKPTSNGSGQRACIRESHTIRDHLDIFTTAALMVGTTREPPMPARIPRSTLTNDQLLTYEKLLYAHTVPMRYHNDTCTVAPLRGNLLAVWLVAVPRLPLS